MAEQGEPLSEREIEVLALLATGATNRQIAHDLFVSVNTVKVHLRNIYTKLGVESRTEATLIAIRDGLVKVPGVEEEPLTDAEVADAEASPPAAPLPPLPWPKRLAFVVSALLVIVASVVAWPRASTSTAQRSSEWENPVNGQAGVGTGGVSTGWKALAPMTTARSRFALVVTADGWLYAIGGETNGGITGSVERYDPNSDQWSLLPNSKPTRVSNIGAAVLDNRIIVPGGLTAEGNPTATVEAYDLTSGEWSQVAPLPRALSSYALATFDGKLFIFGGKDERGLINTTYVYDPESDQWQTGKALPERRAYAAAATVGSFIFVVGGFDGQQEQSTCQVYSPGEDVWDDCEPLTLGRGGLGLAAVANRLYAVGGGWSSYLGFSEEYDPEQGARRFFETPISQQWRNLGIASLPHKFYVAGGWNGDYLNSVWEYVVLDYQIFIPYTP